MDIKKSPICLALDLDDPSQAMAIAEKTQEHVGVFKVGPRLFFNADRKWLQNLSKLRPVFLDFKFFDIPSTMEASVRAAFEMSVTYCTIHGLSGPEALSKLNQLSSELNKQKEFHILSVTMLTSFNDANLPTSLKNDSIQNRVQQIATDVYQSGLKGFVCSPYEVKQIKSRYPNSFLVVPGVRLDVSNKTDDQSRVMTPRETLAQGADLLVIGRPILQAADPALACRQIYESLI